MVDAFLTDCSSVCARDAWSRLGEMSSDRAMGEYVDEMKKVAQEVHDTCTLQMTKIKCTFECMSPINE